MAAATEAPRARHARLHKLKVAAVERLTDDAVAITFDVPPELADEYRFTQGQHVALRSEGLGDDLRRSYSICSPAGSGVLRVAVKRIPGGVFSEFAHSVLKPGDLLDVMTPSGNFFTALSPAQSKRYVAIAAGSGVTPILSLAATTLDLEPLSEFTLLLGNRSTDSIILLEDIEDLKNRHPGRFIVHHVLSRERRESELLSGRIDAAKLASFLETLLPPEEVDEWFLCGPLEMVEELRAALLERAVPAERLHRELFFTGETTPGPVRAALPGAVTSTVSIVLDGRESTFELAPGAESILEAALRARPDAPYACKSAVCGTCRAMLVEGEVELRQNYVLEPHELEQGFVLACQSRPASARVRIDFDS